MTIQKIEIKQRCYTKSGPEILRTTIQNPGSHSKITSASLQPLSDSVVLDIFVGGETHRITVTSRVPQPNNTEMSLVEWHKL
jgi:hypothetical protein